jgi:hypothetical protein
MLVMRLRQELGKFSNFSPEHGIYNLLNAFYKGKSYKISLKTLQIFDSIQKSHTNFPDARQNDISHAIQGVTHDESNWYFTQYYPTWPDHKREGIIWKIPMDVSLNHNFSGTDKNRGIIRKALPSSLLDDKYWHPGDPDYHKDRLLVPVEATGGVRHRGKIAVFNSKNLNFIGSAELYRNKDDRAPWCAINPLDGLLYTSSFCDPCPDPNKFVLYVYAPIITNNSIDLKFKGEFELFDTDGKPALIDRIQGGCFSSSGHLYLSSDTDRSREYGRLYVFDMLSGRKIHSIGVPRKRRKVRSQELEGITVWNTEQKNIDRVEAQIHILMLHAEEWRGMGHDDMYFKHYKVSDPSKL